jgi:hypothetical protein
MALPYPYEVELGQLKPAPRTPRTPFDIQDHILEAIRPAGDQLMMFGVRLPALEPYGGSEIAWLFREMLIEHFQKRRPDADEATWELFESQARAQLDRHPRADSDLLKALMLGIDGL